MMLMLYDDKNGRILTINEILDEKMYLRSLPTLYPGICRLDNELHPKQLHRHGKVHYQKKPFQHCMRSYSKRPSF